MAMASYRRKKQCNNKRNLSNIVPVKNINSPTIVNNVLYHPDTIRWEHRNYSEQPLHFVKLNSNTVEYQDIEENFNNTCKRHFKITGIERIQNPYLMAAFLLKKEEMIDRKSLRTVEQLFHGTRNDLVMKICMDNFNWRFFGNNRGHKFGQGVSFSPNANYATFYGDEDYDNRVMLVVKVLIGLHCHGSSDMTLPITGTDTSIKPNRDVIVKYEDNEFYPAYKIKYCCINPREKKRRKTIERARLRKLKKKGKNSDTVQYTMDQYDLNYAADIYQYMSAIDESAAEYFVSQFYQQNIRNN